MTVTSIQALQEDHFARWKNREAIAESLIPVIGKLYRERNVIVQVFSRTLVNRSVIQMLKVHRRVRMIAGELSVVDTAPFIEALAAMTDVAACKVDLGKIAIDYKNSDKSLSVSDFLRQQLSTVIG
ncbi:MAG TPA: glyceraldehyde-3-phosphate dehydrogenase, partial [Agitococcus sp.]|nr:glyceraldehyde-3-phosphate dehydrogenase [Agitococcus sp.]